MGALNTGEVVKFAIFKPISSYITETTQDGTLWNVTRKVYELCHFQ